MDDYANPFPTFFNWADRVDQGAILSRINSDTDLYPTQKDILRKAFGLPTRESKLLDVIDKLITKLDESLNDDDTVDTVGEWANIIWSTTSALDTLRSLEDVT